MKKVLLVNHKVQNCGVYQFCKRIYDLIKNTNKFSLNYAEVESPHEYRRIVEYLRPDIIIYNWHIGTMSWLTNNILSMDHSKKFFIYHEEHMRDVYDKYLFFGDYDPINKLTDDKKILLPRPLLSYTGNYENNSILTVGSFGFGFSNKGFDKIVSLVNETCTKAIINFLIPPSFFGDPSDTQRKEVIAKCISNNRNKNIVLNIYKDFRTDDEVLKFLARNDINVFLYDENGDGISSVIDYALSVRRPIAISNSGMFRHIRNNNITIPDNSLLDILSLGTSPLDKFYNEWSRNNFIEQFERMIINE